MSRSATDDIFRGFLIINAMLREEVALVRRMLERRAAERKYNLNWPSQPRAPSGVPEGGEWVRGGGGGGRDIPKNRGPRNPRSGHNRPLPDTLQEIFPGLQNAPASAILAPIDGLLGITALGHAANEEATRNLSKELIREIRAIDADYQPPPLAEPGGFPSTIEGRNNYIDGLRQDRAAAVFQASGDTRPLQVETLHFLQRKVDEACTEGVRRYEAGLLSPTLSRERAIGTFVDATVRRHANDLFHRLRISTHVGQPVRVNRRAHNSNDSAYRLPDVRVDRMAFDMTERGLGTRKFAVSSTVTSDRKWSSSSDPASLARTAPTLSRLHTPGGTEHVQKLRALDPV